MSGFDQETWVDLYKSAVLELEHASMAGRIDATRNEIVERVAKLKLIPGLHTEERRAIDDALSSLRSLEREELRHNAEEARNVLGRAMKTLKSIGPTILKPDESRIVSE